MKKSAVYSKLWFFEGDYSRPTFSILLKFAISETNSFCLFSISAKLLWSSALSFSLFRKSYWVFLSEMIRSFIFWVAASLSISLFFNFSSISTIFLYNYFMIFSSFDFSLSCNCFSFGRFFNFPICSSFRFNWSIASLFSF